MRFHSIECYQSLCSCLNTVPFVQLEECLQSEAIRRCLAIMSTLHEDETVSHIRDTSTVIVGDQVYRRLQGVIKFFGFHHGIVIEAPEPYTSDDDIKVIEMTRKEGIRVNTMTGFLDGDYCRLVYYGASEGVYNWHKDGTCHLEHPSPWSDMKERLNSVLSVLQDSDTYCFSGANCEVWMTTITKFRMILCKCQNIGICCLAQDRNLQRD